MMLDEMTWQQLVEKARKFGFRMTERNGSKFLGHPYSSIECYEDGTILSDWFLFHTNYDQMYAIISGVM